MTHDEQELLHYFQTLPDKKISALSDDDANEYMRLDSLSREPIPAPSTYSYSSTDQYEDLKRNVGEVGYSGLDPVQQKLFQDQFAASKFARAGGSFEDAVKYVDSQAKPKEGLGSQLLSGFQDGYQGSREWFGSNISNPILAYINATQTHEGVDAQGHAIPRDPSYANRLEQSYNTLQEDVKHNEGLAGFAADPMNYFGVLGKAAPLVTKLGTIGKMFEGIAATRGTGGGIIASGLGGGLQGGLGYLGNVEDPTLAGLGISTVLGAGIGGAGAVMSEYPARAMASKTNRMQKLEGAIADKTLNPSAVERKYESGLKDVGRGLEDLNQQRMFDKRNVAYSELQEHFSPEQADILASQLAKSGLNRERDILGSAQRDYTFAKEAAREARMEEVARLGRELAAEKATPGMTYLKRVPYIGRDINLGSVFEKGMGTTGELSNVGLGYEIAGKAATQLGESLVPKVVIEGQEVYKDWKNRPTFGF